MNRRHVFADSAAWIALTDSADDLHELAARVYQKLYTRKTRIVTSELVLVEVANSLSAPRLRPYACDLIGNLRTEGKVDVVRLSTELFTEAFHLFSNRKDKEWSLTDCSSFVIMTERKITTAFTSDHHFEQAGFSKLL